VHLWIWISNLDTQWLGINESCLFVPGDNPFVWPAKTVHVATQAVAINVVSCIVNVSARGRFDLEEDRAVHLRSNSR
jgi:hypothetical protein